MDEARSGPLLGDAGEPAFIISAGDPLGPCFVKLYAQLRDGDVTAALQVMAELADVAVDQASNIVPRRDDLDAYEVALRQSSAMAAWRQGKKWCRACFCTDDHACDGGCAWVDGVQPPLCTSCAHSELLVAAGEGGE
jgi:hypothetical protein